MGSKKTPKIQYVGPSPQEINAQYEQQRQLLGQQQSMFAASYQQQISQLQGAYDNSLSLLQQQATERQKANDTILGQLSSQLSAFQQENETTKGLYTALLNRQGEQGMFADAEQQKVAALSGGLRGDNMQSASALFKLLSKRRNVQQDATRNRGSSGAYAQVGLSNSLLR